MLKKNKSKKQVSKNKIVGAIAGAVAVAGGVAFSTKKILENKKEK